MKAKGLSFRQVHALLIAVTGAKSRSLSAIITSALRFNPLLVYNTRKRCSSELKSFKDQAVSRGNGVVSKFMRCFVVIKGNRK